MLSHPMDIIIIIIILVKINYGSNTAFTRREPVPILYYYNVVSSFFTIFFFIECNIILMIRCYKRTGLPINHPMCDLTSVGMYESIKGTAI